MIAQVIEFWVFIRKRELGTEPWMDKTGIGAGSGGGTKADLTPFTKETASTMKENVDVLVLPCADGPVL